MTLGIKLRLFPWCAQLNAHDYHARGSVSVKVRGVTKRYGTVMARDAVDLELLAGGAPTLSGLDLDAHAGEIVGIAGVEGNGQLQIGELLSSLLRLTSGSVEVDGMAVSAGRAGAMAAAGVGVIPEDRHDSGCVLAMTVAENLVLDHPSSVAN